MNFILRRNIIARFVCWILLLQLINISIDPPDLKFISKYNFSQEADLLINEIESFYELISESVFKNDVPESEDNDLDSKVQTIDLYYFNRTATTIAMYSFPVLHSNYYSNYFSSQSLKPNSPPPKHAWLLP